MRGYEIAAFAVIGTLVIVLIGMVIEWARKGRHK
jgi:hypothetical protein